MVHFSESDKMIKISGKEEKSKTYSGFSDNISSLLTEELHQTKICFVFFYILANEEKYELMENVKKY